MNIGAAMLQIYCKDTYYIPPTAPALSLREGIYLARLQRCLNPLSKAGGWRSFRRAGCVSTGYGSTASWRGPGAGWPQGAPHKVA